jgi:hypothetical protein
MKRLHRPDVFGWSEFNEDRNIDFHSMLWVRPGGNVVVDPLPLSPHDRAHLGELGGAAMIIITNSDHVRDAAGLARETGAKLLGPAQEAHDFPLPCDHWLSDGDEVVPGLVAFELDGSKSPGELALVLQGATLITGDLIRAHAGGTLCLLPEQKLADKAAAIRSVRRLAALPGITTVLPGDGWPVFRGADAILREMLAGLEQGSA